LYIRVVCIRDRRGGDAGGGSEEDEEDEDEDEEDEGERGERGEGSTLYIGYGGNLQSVSEFQKLPWCAEARNKKILKFEGDWLGVRRRRRRVWM
jgi:hypothetical protein